MLESDKLRLELVGDCQLESTFSLSLIGAMNEENVEVFTVCKTLHIPAPVSALAFGDIEHLFVGSGIPPKIFFYAIHDTS